MEKEKMTLKSRIKRKWEQFNMWLAIKIATKMLEREFKKEEKDES